MAEPGEDDRGELSQAGYCMSGGTWDAWKRRRGYNPYQGTTQGAFSIEVVAEWPDVYRRINAGMIVGLAKAADELRMSWAANLPGSMAQSVGFRAAPPDSVVIGSDDFRARFFEMGAKKHTITAKAPRHAAREARQAFQLGLRGKARKALRARVLAEALAYGGARALRFQVGYGAGGGVYAAKIKHPGMQKTEPGRNAVREILPHIPGIMAAAIQREL